MKNEQKSIFKVQQISASETASGTAEESNSLDRVEADAVELAVDGDSADCFQWGVNKILLIFL